jgi:hypothetical protein
MTSLTDLQLNFGALVLTDAMKHELLALVKNVLFI